MKLQQVLILVRGKQLVCGTFPSRVATAVASIISSKRMSWIFQIKTGTIHVTYAARVLKSQTSEEIWKHIRQCWMETYLGSPEIIRVDHGSNLSKSYIQTACLNRGIELKAVQTEEAWRVGSVERRLACLACTFKMTVTVRWLSLAQGSNESVTRWQSRRGGDCIEGKRVRKSL
jgi:hypothetical protein